MQQLQRLDVARLYRTWCSVDRIKACHLWGRYDGANASTYAAKRCSVKSSTGTDGLSTSCILQECI